MAEVTTIEKAERLLYNVFNMSESAANPNGDTPLAITVEPSENDFDPERDWPFLNKVLENFGRTQVWPEISGLTKQYYDKLPGINQSQQDKLYRETFITKWNLLNSSIRKDTVSPLSESFHQQSFVASVAKEFGGKRISSCVIASTLNALAGLGFELGDKSKLEKEVLTHLFGLYQQGKISYNAASLDLGVGTTMAIVDYLRADSELHLSATAKSDYLNPEGIMEGLLEGSNFIYSAGGHARAIVGITEEAENIKLLIVDPLSQKPQTKSYSIEEVVNGGGDLPPISLTISEFIRIIRTDKNAVDMSGTMPESNTKFWEESIDRMLKSEFFRIAYTNHGSVTLAALTYELRFNLRDKRLGERQYKELVAKAKMIISSTRKNPEIGKIDPANLKTALLSDPVSETIFSSTQSLLAAAIGFDLRQELLAEQLKPDEFVDLTKKIFKLYVE